MPSKEHADVRTLLKGRATPALGFVDLDAEGRPFKAKWGGGLRYVFIYGFGQVAHPLRCVMYGNTPVIFIRGDPKINGSAATRFW